MQLQAKHKTSRDILKLRGPSLLSSSSHLTTQEWGAAGYFWLWFVAQIWRHLLSIRVFKKKKKKRRVRTLSVTWVPEAEIKNRLLRTGRTAPTACLFPASPTWGEGGEGVKGHVNRGQSQLRVVEQLLRWQEGRWFEMKTSSRSCLVCECAFRHDYIKSQTAPRNRNNAWWRTN